MQLQLDCSCSARPFQPLDFAPAGLVCNEEPMGRGTNRDEEPGVLSAGDLYIILANWDTIDVGASISC